MAWYIEDKNGVRKKISGTSIDAGLKEVPIASETIVGGVISSTNSGSLSVNQSTGEAKINDNLIIAGGGQVVLEGDFGEPPYTITIDKNPPSASQTGYDNSISGLSATNVQNAIDKIVQNDNEQENKIVTNTLNITNLKDKTTYYSNKNLLDNWYFINPINQRGLTSYNNSSYGIDRWMTTHTGVITIENGYVSVEATKTSFTNFQQIIEPERYGNSEFLTFSALVSGDVVGCSINCGQINWKSQPIVSTDNAIKLVTLTFKPSELADLSLLYCVIQIVASTDTQVNKLNIYAVKLELGTQQTLAHQDSSGNWVLNDAPPNPAEELLKCQRYFYRTIPDSNGYSLDGFGQATQENIVLTNFYFPTVMRDGGNPSITLSDGSKFALVNYANELWGNTTHNITNVTINQFHGNYVFLYLYSTNLIPGLHYFYQMNGGYIDFSRDL